MILRGKSRSTLREICPPKTHTRIGLGSKPPLTGERLGINSLSHNTVHPVTSLSVYGIYLHDVSTSENVTKTCITNIR